MKIIDVRSGRELALGDEVKYRYSPNDSYRLLRVSAGLTEATFTVKYTDGRVVNVKGPIRYFHPSFPFRRVAFFPS